MKRYLPIMLCFLSGIGSNMYSGDARRQRILTTLNKAKELQAYTNRWNNTAREIVDTQGQLATELIGDSYQPGHLQGLLTTAFRKEQFTATDSYALFLVATTRQIELDKAEATVRLQKHQMTEKNTTISFLLGTTATFGLLSGWAYRSLIGKGLKFFFVQTPGALLGLMQRGFSGAYHANRSTKLYVGGALALAAGYFWWRSHKKQQGLIPEAGARNRGQQNKASSHSEELLQELPAIGSTSGE